MCIQTLVDDGGLEDVLRTSDRVWNELCSLHEKKQAQLTAGADTKSGTSATGAARSKMRTRASWLGGDGGSKVLLDLSQHSESELKRAVAPLITDMEKLDAAALLSLNPVDHVLENYTSKCEGAALDPKRGLTVTPIHDRVFPPCDNSYSDDNDNDEIMGEMEMNNNRVENNSRNIKNVVRYLHVVDVPHKYSVGIFVFPPNARMPLHDHPNMIVLSRVLYGELQVQSYDIVHPVRPPTNDDNADAHVSVTNNTDTAIIDHHFDDDDFNDEATTGAIAATSSTSPTKTTGVLRKSLTKIKDYISMKIVSHSSHGNNDDGDSAMRRDPVLYVRPNLNPVGTMRRRSSMTMPVPSSVEVSNVCEDTGVDEEDQVIISAPRVTCLFPREGNCHAFVAGPQGAALLDVLLPPYDTEEVRDCTFYEVANENFPIHSTTTSSALKLNPINQPDDFHCVSGSYGRFGACNYD